MVSTEYLQGSARSTWVASTEYLGGKHGVPGRLSTEYLGGKQRLCRSLVVKEAEQLDALLLLLLHGKYLR